MADILQNGQNTRIGAVSTSFILPYHFDKSGEFRPINKKCFSCGRHIDIENDGFMNEPISVEEHKGELKLKPMVSQIRRFANGVRRIGYGWIEKWNEKILPACVCQHAGKGF